MRKLSIPLICILLCALTSLAAPKPVNDPAQEKQVIDTLNRFGQAIVKKDMPTLNSVLHEDLSWGHATGHTQSKAEMLQTISGTEIWERFDFSKETIHFYGPTAVVRCQADIRNGTPPQPIHDGKFTMLLVLLKGDQGWQIVGEQRAHVDEK